MRIPTLKESTCVYVRNAYFDETLISKGHKYSGRNPCSKITTPLVTAPNTISRISKKIAVVLWHRYIPIMIGKPINN